jgi:pyruvate formate lyase activating enzyme
MQEAQHFKKIKNKIIQCTLCPHYCILHDLQTGKCDVRTNREGILHILNYGLISGMNADHIEKKPLYHFYPSKKILSVGTLGCNMACNFCQNYSISQPESLNLAGTLKQTPDEIVAAAQLEPNNIGIAYTYNEPTIWYEFVLDTAKKAAQKNLKNVLVSNGFINPEPLKQWLPYMDAVNIDIKSYSEGFYKEITGAKLHPVLETIKTIARNNIHIEITLLIIPELNDDINDFKALVKFLKNEVGENTVLHLSRYFPIYKSHQAITPEKTLKTLFDEAKKMLNFVYLGNINTKYGKDTFCPNCNTKLIERYRYNTQIPNLDKDGNCTKCGYHLLNHI